MIEERDEVIAKVCSPSRAYRAASFSRTVLNLVLEPRVHPWKPRPPLARSPSTWTFGLPLGAAIIFLAIAFFSGGCATSQDTGAELQAPRRDAVLGLSPAELAMCDTGHLDHQVVIPEDSAAPIFMAVRIPAALGPVRVTVAPGEGTSLDHAQISAKFDPPLDKRIPIHMEASAPIAVELEKDRILELTIRPKDQQDDEAWSKSCERRAGALVCSIRVEAQAAFGGQKELEKILTAAARMLEDADRLLGEQSARPVPDVGGVLAGLDYELRPDGPCGGAIPEELGPAIEQAVNAIHEARLDMYGGDRPAPFDPAKVEGALGRLEVTLENSAALAAAAKAAKWRGIAGLPSVAAHVRAMKSIKSMVAREHHRDAAFWVALAGSKNETKYRSWFRHAPPLGSLSDAMTRIAFAAALGTRPTATVIVGERPFTVPLPAATFRITSGLCYGKGSNLPVPDQTAAAERAAELTIGGRSLVIESLDDALRAASAAERAAGVLCELDFDATKLRHDLEARLDLSSLDELRADLDRLEDVIHFGASAREKSPLGKKVAEIVAKLPKSMLRPAMLEKRAGSMESFARMLEDARAISAMAGVSETEWSASLVEVFSSSDFLERALVKKADAGLGALRADLIILDAAIGYRKRGGAIGDAAAEHVERAFCSIFSEGSLAKRLKKVSDYRSFVRDGRDILSLAPSDQLSCARSRLPVAEIRPRIRAAYQQALASMKLSPLQLAAVVRQELELEEPHVADVVESDPLLLDIAPPFALPDATVRNYFETCNEKYCEELDALRAKLPENTPELAFKSCPKESNEGRLLTMELPPVGTEIAEMRRCPSKDWVELTRLKGSGPALLLSSPDNFLVGTDSARKRTHMQHGSVYTLVIPLDDRTSVSGNKIFLISTAHGQRFWVSTLRVGELARGN